MKDRNKEEGNRLEALGFLGGVSQEDLEEVVKVTTEGITLSNGLKLDLPSSSHPDAANSSGFLEGIFQYMPPTTELKPCKEDGTNPYSNWCQERIGKEKKYQRE